MARLENSAQTITQELVSDLIPANELLRLPEYSDWDLETPESIASIQSEVAAQAQMIGYVNVFWLLTWVCTGAAIVAAAFSASGQRACVSTH